jgi:hypothetical protein
MARLDGWCQMLLVDVTLRSSGNSVNCPSISGSGPQRFTKRSPADGRPMLALAALIRLSAAAIVEKKKPLI